MADSGPAQRPAPPGGLRYIYGAHDVLTRLSFQLAVACLAIITASFCYEVVARYAFNAPTVWANPLVSYLLCAMIFLALPEMTRTTQHISINLLIDALPAGAAALCNQLIRLIGIVACVLGAWVTGTETGAQIVGDIWTISYFPVPKWVLRSVFGEMANATLLASARACSGRLQATGFRFRHEKLESALRAELG